MKFIKKILSFFLGLFKKKKEKRETIWLKEALTVKELLDSKPIPKQTSVSNELKIDPKIKEAYQKHKAKQENKQEKLAEIKEADKKNKIKQTNEQEELPDSRNSKNYHKQLPKIKKNEADIYFETVTNFIKNAKREFTEKEFIERKLEILHFLKTLKK